MTLIVRMTSKIADCGYYVSVIFGSLTWEGESSGSEPAHRYKATKGHSHKASGGADPVSACQLNQHGQNTPSIWVKCSIAIFNLLGCFINIHQASETCARIFKQKELASLLAHILKAKYELWNGGNLTSDIHHYSLRGRRTGTELCERSRLDMN